MAGGQAGRTRVRSRLIRVVLVERHALVRAVLRQMVDGEPDIAVVGEASDIADAIAGFADDPPDVVLVDTDGPLAGVVPHVQRLRRECPASQVILVSGSDGDDELFQAIQAGAAAHLSDDTRPGQLVGAIRAVADGTYVIDETIAARPAVARRVLEAFRDVSLFGEIADGDVAREALAPLSHRETEILEKIAHGLSNRDVAAALGISEQTVKNHVANILRKLAVNGRTQAVLYALRKSWIPLPEEAPTRRH